MLEYSVKLVFESEEHRNFWKALLLTSTDIYNDISKMIVDNGCHLSLKSVHALVYNTLREKYPNVPAQVVVKIYKEVLGRLRAIKTKLKKVVYSERVKHCMTLDDKLYCKLDKSGIKLTSHIHHKRFFVKFVSYAKFDELASMYKMGDPTIHLDGEDMSLSIPFKVTEKPIKDESRLGVDLGIKRIFTTSDGVAYGGSYINGIKRKIRYNKRKLNSVFSKKKSKSALRKLKKYSRKERNVSKNYAHLICNKILDTDKSIIVLEDLTGIKQSTTKTKNGYKRKRHNNMISQVPFYMIKYILTYKAPLLGKKVETVSPAYTSQTNCLTSKKDGERKGCRYYTKKKGLVLDADWNAAINIAKRYSRHSQSFDIPIDGRLKLLRQAVSQSAESRGVKATCK